MNNSKVKCKNCIHANFKKTEKGNVKASVAGTCEYIIPMPKVPNSYGQGIRGPTDLNYYKSSIWANDEHECPCFELAKPSEK